MSYAELLKDPRWQKKRLEIMERDEWTCQECGDTKATLTVHHKSYRMVNGKFVDIWDYQGEDFITLCQMCHDKEEQSLKNYSRDVFFTLRDRFDNSGSFSAMIAVIEQLYRNVDDRILAEHFEVMYDLLNTIFESKTDFYLSPTIMAHAIKKINACGVDK
jgi:hypothetical protein